MTFLPEGYFAHLGTAPREALDRQFVAWSTQRDAIVPFIGEHAATLFGHAISDENDAVVTTVYFRKALIDSGEDPDAPTVTEAEQSLIDWGRMLAHQPAVVPIEFQERIDDTFSEQLRARLTAFAAETIEANRIEADLGIELDSRLDGFRKPGEARTAS